MCVIYVLMKYFSFKIKEWLANNKELAALLNQELQMTITDSALATAGNVYYLIASGLLLCDCFWKTRVIINDS